MRQPLTAGDPYHIPTAIDKRFKIGVNAGGENLYVVIKAVSGDNCPIKGMHFRWLTTLSQRRFAQFTRSHGKRKGFSLVGEGLKLPELRKLVEDLGLPAAYVDVARNRIAYAEFALAMKPLECAIADHKELSDYERTRRGEMLEAHMESIEGPGIHAIRRQVGDHLDRKEFHTREGRPFVSMVPAPSGG